MSLTTITFSFVAKVLHKTAEIIGLTYEEVNILLYYLAVPLVYVSVLDAILGSHYIKAIWLIVTALFVFPVNRFKERSMALFGRSVTFLKWFARFGLDYLQASVLVCVVLPVVVLLVLLAFL